MRIKNLTPYRKRTAVDGMLTANQVANRQYKVDKFVKTNNLSTVEDVLEDIAKSTPYRERTAVDGMLTKKYNLDDAVSKILPKKEIVEMKQHPDVETIKLCNGEMLTRSTGNADYYEIYKDGIKQSKQSAFVPKKGKYKSKKFTRTVDDSNEGIRISELRSGKYDIKKLATFTEKEFAPEIESKIRMKDFDNISFLNKNYPLDSTHVYTTYDLGDGLVLKRSNTHSFLLKGEQEIRTLYIEEEGIVSSIKNDKNCAIWYQNGKYKWHR